MEHKVEDRGSFKLSKGFSEQLTVIPYLLKNLLFVVIFQKLLGKNVLSTKVFIVDDESSSCESNNSSNSETDCDVSNNE